jgi:hypothetical protein
MLCFNEQGHEQDARASAREAYLFQLQHQQIIVKPIKKYIMKKLNKLVLTISAITALLLYSCDKETDNIVTPDTDAFKILKVEVLEPYYPYFPFYNNLALVEYNYDNDEMLKGIDIWCNKSKSTCNNDFPFFISMNGLFFDVTRNQDAVNISVKDDPYGYFLGFYMGLNNMKIMLNNGNINSIATSYDYKFPTNILFTDFLQQSIEFVKEGNSGLKEVILNTSFNPGPGDTTLGPRRVFSIISRLDNRVAQASVKETFEELDLTYKYQTDSSMPTMLISLVNEAIINAVPLGFQDNLIHWYNTDFKPTVKNTSFANWIFLFGIPELGLVQGEQDAILSEVRTTGKKLVSYDPQTPGSEVYETINETKTFPYVHDPVNKTLEINSIKIYYQTSGN